MPESQSTRKPRKAPVRLHDIQVERLHRIAEATSMSLADTFSRMIAKEIAAGVIPADIPGVTLSREDDAITMNLDGGLPVRLSLGEAQATADALRMRAQGSKTRQAAWIVAEAQAPYRGLRWVNVTRRGTSIGIQIGDQMMLTSVSVALELADLIEKTAA